jgi:hypothetical protein
LLLVVAVLAVDRALRTPDPFAFPDRPDDYRALIPTAIVGLVAAALCGGLMAYTTARWRSDWPGGRTVERRIADTACVMAAIVVVLLGGRWATEHGHILRRADCTDFRFSAAAWRSSTPWRRVQVADGIARCNAFAGLSKATVRLRLGPDFRTTPGVLPEDDPPSVSLFYPLRVRSAGGSMLVLSLQAGDDGRISSAALAT